MKYTFRIPAQRSIILFLLFKLSVSCYAQPENKIATADKPVQQLLDWRIIGPLKDTLKNISDLASLPVNGLEPWQGIITDTIYHQENEQIDLSTLLKTRDSAIGYAICKVFADNDQEIRFIINVDDAMRLWVNNSQVLPVPSYTRNGGVLRRAYLKKGMNTIIAEIRNKGGIWVFDVDITANKVGDLSSAFLSLPIPENNIKEVQQSKVQLQNWRITGPFNSTLADIDMNQLGYLRFIPGNTRQNIIDTLYRQEKEGGDLNGLLGADRKGVAYAICDVVSDENQDLALLVNVNLNNEMRLWINDSLVLSERTYSRGATLLRKIHLKKGVSRLISEIKNVTGEWGFIITTSGYEYVRNNALIPGFYSSAQKFIISEGDSLSLGVADPDFVPVKNISTVKIFDARNRNCYTGQIDLKKYSKFALPYLAAGAYRFELYTDRDTLNEYFCYGALDKIYNREKLAQEYEHKKIVYDALLPYMKRLDRLLDDYKKTPNVPLSKKIVYCIYKVEEIDSAYQHGRLADLNSTGLSIRMFTSSIEHGEDYYLLYVPENLKKQHTPIPLVVIVPYVTNNHPFYTGSVIANTDRITYISKFAERCGMAVLWPSSRIFRWYNQTPIVTRSITESIEDACRRYTIDKKNIFLYGDCSGGLFAFQTAIRRPDLFAAIAVDGPEFSTVSSDESDISGLLTNNLFDLTENLYGKHILILHSANDQKIPVDRSLRLMDSIKNTGGSVYYDDLNNVLKTRNNRLYSEAEAMNKIFSFFNAQKYSSPGPVKKIATFGFYNDTVYGVFVKEKTGPGKSIISYQINKSRLELTTKNVRKLIIDTRKMDFEDLKNITIHFNGKRLVKGIDYKIAGPIIEITNAANEKGKYFTKEVCGPVNKVFLNTFAIVRPAAFNERIKRSIAAIDSLWLGEYRNHVLVIDEKEVDSAKRKGVNLIYIVNDLRQVKEPVLKTGGIQLKNDSLKYKGEILEDLRKTEFSFAFYFRDKNNTDNMYLGLNTTDMPFEMLKSLFIRKGWCDFELWQGEYPVIQNNYETFEN
jgi:dienelactone hydrolase